MRCPTINELPEPPAGKTGWPWTEESWPVSALLTDGHPRPRVSVITPSYNQSEYIEETIRSVLLQGYPDLEYLVIDGGSDDGSVDIIRKYEPWLAYWVSEPDHGQTQAINKGWAQATGKIVTYINSDDTYLPGTIEAAVEGFCANPQAGMVYGTATIINEAGNEIRVWESRPFNFREMLAKGSIVPQPATFFSNDALRIAGVLDEKWQMIMDYELCIRIGLQFPTVCLPKTLARFRDHSQSKTRTRFEATATELLRFLAAFQPDQVPFREWKSLKQAAISRVHYELALAYLAQGWQFAPKARKQLLLSIARYPFFAMKRPFDTAYIVKEVFLSYFTRNHTRSSSLKSGQPLPH